MNDPIMDHLNRHLHELDKAAARGEEIARIAGLMERNPNKVMEIVDELLADDGTIPNAIIARWYMAEPSDHAEQVARLAPLRALIDAEVQKRATAYYENIERDSGR